MGVRSNESATLHPRTASPQRLRQIVGQPATVREQQPPLVECRLPRRNRRLRPGRQIKPFIQITFWSAAAAAAAFVCHEAMLLNSRRAEGSRTRNPLRFAPMPRTLERISGQRLAPSLAPFVQRRPVDVRATHPKSGYAITRPWTGAKLRYRFRQRRRHDRGAMLERRAPALQREGDVAGIEIGCAFETHTQRLDHRVQRRGSARRQRKDVLLVVSSVAVRKQRRLFEYDVHVGSADAERAHAGATHARAARPRRRTRADLEWPGGEVDVRIGSGVMHRRRDELVLQSEHGLDQAGHAGCRVGVTDVRLHRADEAARFARRARSEHARERRDLHRIAELRPGAVRFDDIDARAVDARVLQRRRDRRGLPFHARRGEADLGRAVVVRCRSADHRQHAIAVRERRGQRLEHDHPRAAAAHRAARRGIEGAALAVRREDHPRLVQIAAGLREEERHAARQRHPASAGAQALAGQIDRQQRRRAGRLHRHARPAQVELVRHQRGQKILVVADHGLIRGARIARQLVGKDVRAQIRVHPRAGEHADVSAGARRVAGIFERVPRAFEKHALLRIEHFRLARTEGEKGGVEAVDLRDHAARAHVLGAAHQLCIESLPEQLFFGERGDRVPAVGEQLPESVHVVRAGIAAGHADDGDRLVRIKTLAPLRHERRRILGGERACQRADGRKAEEIDQRERSAEAFFDRRMDARQQKRMAADVEEVVVESDLRAAEDFAPDGGELPLRCRHRRLRHDRRRHRRRERVPVDLAVMGERHVIDRDELGWHEVRRKQRAQCVAQRGDVECVVIARHDPGDEHGLAVRAGRVPTSVRATSGCLASTASISPGSMRKPRILSWRSARPRNSRRPSKRKRARSPVRYIRSPGAPSMAATKRCAVSAVRPA